MDYEIKDGELHLLGKGRLTMRYVAQCTVLLARAKNLTVDDAIDQGLARQGLDADEPYVSAYGRKVREAVSELLASGWTPADSGTLD
jgi:hypothetical protein